MCLLLNYSFFHFTKHIPFTLFSTEDAQLEMYETYIIYYSMMRK